MTLDSNNVTACSGGPAPAVGPPVAVPPVITSGVGIPTLSWWAMIALAGLLARVAYSAIRKRAA